MDNQNRLFKWGLIVVLVAGALLILYPPKDTLKPGIDLAGGSVLIYEIDTAGLDDREKQGLAERVMNILKSRVDPNSQFNLVWRPIGDNRLEIQMPRPPAEAKERRDRYEAARDQVRELNVPRTELEQVLALSGAARETALADLAAGVPGRDVLLKRAAEAWDEYLAVRGSGDVAAEVPAQVAYDEAVEAVQLSNLPLARLTDVLVLNEKERETELKKLKDEYPAYASAIDDTTTAYDQWSSKRGSLEDPADLKRLLRGAGVLEFRVLAQRDLGDPTMLVEPGQGGREPIARYVTQLQKRGPRPKSGDRYMWFEVDDFIKFMQSDTMEQAEARRAQGSVVVEKYAGKWYVLAHADLGDQRFGLTQASPPWALKRAFPSRDPSDNSPVVDFILDARGGAQFAGITQLNTGRELSIFLDQVATSHATIRSTIGQRGQISGGFTDDDVRRIVQKLEAGSLPARLKETPLQEKVTGPSLGESNRRRGMQAAFYGLGAVMIFMLIYYLFAGVLADIALVMNLLLVLAIMALLEATFTLPGIAGLLLTVGMAVDANVLIFERIREERARGIALKKAVKTGYEKALSTIVDANLTTLITCVILGYVGSEEVKGFAMTLGFGIVTSMFTALFVTRVILTTLMDLGVVKSLSMLQLIKRPNVDWIGLRRVFWPVSLVLAVGGMGYFVFVANTDKESVYDIEFLGGTSVQIELAKVEAGEEKLDIDGVRAAVTGKGSNRSSATQWLRDASEALRSARVAAADAAGEFTVTSEQLKPAEINALLRATFEERLALGGFTGSGSTARFVTREIEAKADAEGQVDLAKSKVMELDAFKAGVLEAADYAAKAAERLAAAKIQTVSGVDESEEENAYEVATVESKKDLVRAAILATLGDKLKIERRIDYTLVTDPERAPTGMFPILEEHNFLGQVIDGDSPADVRAHKGGVALVFDELEPPQTITAIEERFKQMRLQPQFQRYESRGYNVIGLNEVDKSDDGVLYDKVALVVSDESLAYSDDPLQWEERMAKPELQQAEEAFSAEESLRKVVQFAPQIARQTQQKALIAMVLALSAIVAYVWIRFGTMQYGLAAIVALVHDVSFTLGVITLADVLGIGDFRIDLAMIAALLTVVGYSLNDTIVVFDRIRENRGKLSKLSTNIINNSINMTLSRTLLTSMTTMLAVAFLFFMGGPGVHGFSFALICGVLVGTYSSVGIAAPLLHNRRLLHTVIYVLIAATLVGLAAAMVDSGVFVAVVAGLMLVFLAFAIRVERRMDYPLGTPAGA
jgi:protein-export membrane protein SecD/preprotein translocase SecF subunit